MNQALTVSARQIDAVANLLEEAARSATPCAPVKSLLPEGDIDAAYAVQAEVTARAVRKGRRIVGRKIGLTSLAVQKQLGVDQPDFGVLFDDMTFQSEEAIPWSRLLQPKVEAEVALVLKHALDGPHLTLEDIAAATDYAVAAIEVVGSRIANWQISLVDTIADNASSGVYVIGSDHRPLADVDLRLCGMVMTRRAEIVSLGVGAACLGHPLNAALWLARKLVELGTPLKAGETILTGALGPMVPVLPGDVVTAEIAGLGAIRAVFAPA
jgi:2-keto-4-pentenoate hydratase